MKSTYEVRVEAIRFDAAHFATYGGNCEPLHGHSYEVAAEVQGKLGEDSLVVNFIGLKAVLRELSKELDHKFMLLGRMISDNPESIIARYRDLHTKSAAEIQAINDFDLPIRGKFD